MMGCRVLYLVSFVIKNILFDFDGVILDSMKIKGDGFVELFSAYDSNAAKRFEPYHYANGGISRFAKIRYFFNTLLDKEIDDDEVGTLADRFADIIAHKLQDKNNLIQDTLKFIEKNHNNYHMHIVSGAEHNELNMLCKNFHIDKFFITVNGSPIKKSILIKNIMDKYSYTTEETVVVGDSINDYEAACENGVKFYGYNNPDLRSLGYIETFDGFVF